MTNTPRINFYATKGHPCSYLENKQASTVFVDPNFDITSDVYSRLSEKGFRRSGEHLYRPHCSNCNACIPLRIPTQLFTPSKQQKRTWNKNCDLEIEITEDISSPEHYALYDNYISTRHSDGDMYPPNPEQFDSFLSSQWEVTHYIEFRLNHRLLCVAVTDTLDNGLSAIYTFYDPQEHQRSLGVYAVLFQIQLAKRLKLPYVYLGYWIKDSQKMSYKSNYRPFEIYQDANWLLVR